jgi:hypothetical protein
VHDVVLRRRHPEDEAASCTRFFTDRKCYLVDFQADNVGIPQA